MANKNNTSYIRSTCLSFDLEDEDDKKIYDVMSSLGSRTKLFVKTLLYTLFSSEVTAEKQESGKYKVDVTGDRLKKLVKNYKKDYSKEHPKDVIFLNWDKRDETDMTCLRILIPFAGGVNDFIKAMFKEHYKFLFLDYANLPSYAKITRSGTGTSKSGTSKRSTCPNSKSKPIVHTAPSIPEPSDEDDEPIDIVIAGIEELDKNSYDRTNSQSILYSITEIT